MLLAAGAINSPHLLQLSGIGDAVRLQRDRRAGGASPARASARACATTTPCALAWRVRGAPTLNERAAGLPLLREVLRYAAVPARPAGDEPGACGRVPAHPAGARHARLQLFFAPASFEGGRTGQAPLERLPGMTCGCSQLRPESRGWVRALSPDPAAPPEIQPNYLADPIDRQTTVAGMRAVRQIFAAPALARFCAAELLPGPEVASDAELLAHASERGSTIYHPIGSCRMGIDPLAVVDHRLRVAASRACAWSTPRSCRPCRPATPMPRRSWLRRRVLI